MSGPSSGNIPQYTAAGAGLINAGAQVYGAQQQDQVAQQNFEAQQKQQQLINQLVQSYLTPSGTQNPFAQQIQQFLGSGGGGGNFQPARGTTQPSGFSGGTPGGSIITPPTRLGPGNIPPTTGDPGISDGGLGRLSALTSVMPNFGFSEQLMAPPPSDTNPSVPSNPPTMSGGGGGGSGTGTNVGGPQQYQYQAPPNSMFNYTPAQTTSVPTATAAHATAPGAAPSVVAANAPSVFAPIANASSASPAQVTLPQAAQASLLGAAPQATGTQGSNAGQDGLLQLMRTNLQPSTDPTLANQIQQMGAGNSQFDNSALFASLKPLRDQATQQQVDQLHASAGSLGQRFGTAMAGKEALLRSNIQNTSNAQDAQIAQQSFEAAQNRALQAQGLGSQNLQALNQFGLANQGQQIQAGTAAGQLQQGTAAQQLQAQLANLGVASQYGLANQQAQNTFGLANQQNAMQAAMANAGYGQQAGLQNQSIAAQLAQFNAQQGLGSQQFNASNMLQNNQFNAGLQQQSGLQNQQIQSQTALANLNAAMQAIMGNQQVGAQYGLANQAAFNQAGQFNAGMNMQNSQFGAQQGNIYNNLQMSGLMNAAGLQNQSQSNNNQLLGILNGVGVPQAQVSAIPGAIGSAAQTAMFLPMLMQMMSGGGGGSSGPNYY